MSRKDLFTDVWRAAGIMRTDDGTNGINEYIEQISWMFFLKVFEDLERRFESEHQILNKKYERIIPDKYSWSNWIKKDTKEIIGYVDNVLFPFLAKLSGSPEKNTISIIFQEIQRNKMKSASNFKDVIDIINEINFNNEEDSHILSVFYEELLLKLGKESGIAGEFYTPRPIVKLLVKMIAPQLNQKDKASTKILDPFCGSCGFLVESYKHIMNSGKINAKDIQLVQRNVFHGYEKKSLPFIVGLMNCVFHELITPNVLRKNSLNENILNFGPEDKFDYILTNPPFGGKENRLIQQNFPIKSSSTELLALQQVIRRLKINGKCGIVVPEGLLSQGDEFIKVKKDLLENQNVHTIISLPSGSFANVTSSGKGPKTNLLLFDNNGATKEIWYYELKSPTGKEYSKSNPLEEEHLVDCYNKWKKREKSKNSWIVTIDNLIKNGYDLSANNPNTVDEIKKPFSEVLSDFNKKIEKYNKLLSSVNNLISTQFPFSHDLDLGKLPKNWEMKRIGDEEVAEIIMGQSPPGNTYNDKKIGLPFYQGKADFGEDHPEPRVWCSKPKKVARKGDILISIRAPVGPTNWANEECCIGRGLASIRPKINKKYVYYYLKILESKLQNFGQKGSIFNAMNKSHLFELPIPVPKDPDVQKEVVDYIDKIYPMLKELIKLNFELKSEVALLPSLVINKTMLGSVVINLKK